MGKRNFIRNVFAFFQAVIDVSIYFMSFSLVFFLWSGWEKTSALTFETQIFFAGTILAVFCFKSLYSFKTWLFWDELKAVIKSSFFILLVIVLYLYSQKSNLSRFAVLFSMIIFVPLCAISRYVFRRLLFALGLLSTNIIVLGAGRMGSIFAEKITGHPFTLGKIAGFLDDDESKIGTTVAGCKVLGKIEDFAVICAEERIDEAAVAISKASRNLLVHVLNIVEFHVRQVHYVPDMYMLTTFSSLVRDVDGMPVVSSSQGLLNPVNRAVKSFADYAVGIIAIIILSPFMIFAAMRAKRKFGGKIFSRQERCGLEWRKFMMYRFRSSGEYGTDTRLRRSYIDEFPQLFNVIRGDMSIVGPKALSNDDMIHVYGLDTAGKILTVKPGITGFWQVSARRLNDRKILREMNLYYIRNWSLWLDFVILLKTFLMPFFRRNA